MGRRFTGRRGGSRAWAGCALALAIAGLMAVPALLLPAAAGASTWEPGVAVGAPAIAGEAELNDLACPAAGSCVAVGSYQDALGWRAMAATEVNGAWGEPTEIEAPDGAENAELRGVACPAAGSCVAVGNYEDGQGEIHAFAATEAGGSWGRGVEVKAPEGADFARLSGVACVVSGPCVAVGNYKVQSVRHVMTATETGGSWAQAEEVEVPGDAEGTELNGVACTAAGSCVAVGTYEEGPYQHAMTATETGGTWGEAEEVEAPGGADDAWLSGIACPAAGSCVAAGTYHEGTEEHAMVAGQTTGTWGQAEEVAAPTGAKGAHLNDLACPAAGSCVAIGGYRASSSSGWQPLVATESSGSWNPSGVEAPTGAGEAELGGVACPTSGSCTAIGIDWGDRNERHPIAVGATGGSWGQAVEVEPPSRPTADDLYGVACPAAGSCAAVGGYGKGSDWHASIATESGGSWGQAVEIETPGNFARYPRDPVGTGLNDVDCTAPGSCTAVGYFYELFSYEEPMVATETNGIWSEPSYIEPPAAADYAWLTGIDCTAPGSCVAVGNYWDGSEERAMVATETGGFWDQAEEIEAPAGAEEASVGRVACPAAGPCVVTGGYEDDEGERQPMVATLGGGTPVKAVEVAMPPGMESGELYGVACGAGGTCTAVGGSWDGSNEHPMAATETGGIWSQAAAVKAPAGAIAAWLNNIACPAAGPCVAVGGSWNGSREFAMAATETGGAWGQGFRLEAPAGAEGSDMHGIACPAAGPCVAVGDYEEDSVWHAMTTREAPEEESSGSPTSPPTVSPIPPTPNATCSVTVRGAKVAVKGGKARVKIADTGAARCAGRVKLVIEVKAKRHRAGAKDRAKGARAGHEPRHARFQTIGSSSFRLAPGKTATIAIKLNRRGRAALRAHHGRLGATLSVSGGRRLVTKRVRLTERHKHQRKRPVHR